MQMRKLIDGWKGGREEGLSAGQGGGVGLLTLKQMADVLSRQVSDPSFI